MSGIIVYFVLAIEGSPTMKQKYLMMNAIKGEEYSPSIEISLTPARKPFPQLSAEIQQLDERREKLEKLQYKNLTVFFQEELVRAEKNITQTVSDFMHRFDDPVIIEHALKGIPSFLQAAEYKVEVEPHVSILSPEIGGRIRHFEEFREKNSNYTYDQGIQLLQNVTRTVVVTLNVTLHDQIRPLLVQKKMALIQLQAVTDVHNRCKELASQTLPNLECPEVPDPSSFLQNYDMESQGTFGGSATVGRIFEGLEFRRDVSEDLLSEELLAMALRLAKEELLIAQKSLTTSMSVILESYKDVFKLLIDKYPK
jgi:hypothetical protein